MARGAEPRKGKSRGAAAATVASLLVTLGVVVAFVLMGWIARPPSPSEPVLELPDASVVGAAGSARIDATPTAAGENTNRTDVGPSRADALAGAVATMRVRVSQLLGARNRHYTGPLLISIDGENVVDTTLVNNDPVVFAASRTAQRIRFEAPGYLPRELTLPQLMQTTEAKGQRGAPASIGLEPAARVRFEVSGLMERAGAQLEVALATTALQATGQCALTRNEAGEGIAFVPGAEFAWSATLVQGTSRRQWSGREGALQFGERRTITLDVAAAPVRRYQLVGVSTELIAMLTAYRRRPGDNEGQAVKFAADGSCELSPLPDAIWSCHGAHLLEEPRAEETLLRPEGGLVAIGLRQASGQAVSAALLDADGRVLDTQREWHVLPRATLPAVVRLGLNFTNSRTVIARDLPIDRDVVAFLPWSAADTPAYVRLTMQGQTPDARVAPRLVVEILADGEPFAREQVGELGGGAAVPPGKGLDLRWRIGTSPGPVIARGVRVAAGAIQEIAAAWPATKWWTGRVDGLAEMPEARRWHRVTWGEATPTAVFGRGMERLIGDGTFSLLLPAGEGLDATWTLLHGMTRIAAVVDAVDVERGTFVVRPRSEVLWVAPRVEIPPPWVLLVVAGVGSPAGNLGSHDQQRPVPLLAGDALHGVVLTNMRAVAWFTLDANAATRPIRATGGRTITVRTRATNLTRHVCLVGPAGQLDIGNEVAGDRPLSLFVPDGTRAIAVFDEARPNDAPVELPLPAGDVLVVD